MKLLNFFKRLVELYRTENEKPVYSICDIESDHDGVHHLLVLVRDRFMIKPLSYRPKEILESNGMMVNFSKEDRELIVKCVDNKFDIIYKIKDIAFNYDEEIVLVKYFLLIQENKTDRAIFNAQPKTLISKKKHLFFSKTDMDKIFLAEKESQVFLN